MAMDPWNPLHDVQLVRTMIDHFFQESLGTQGSFPVDIAETDSGYIVHASLPGIKPEDMDVRVEGNTLTIRGETKTEQQQQGQDQRWLRREHRTSSFYRSLTLPATINPEQVQANYENGVLTLSLPKATPAKSQQITINTGAQPQPQSTVGQDAEDRVTTASEDSFPASDPPSMGSPTPSPSE